MGDLTANFSRFEFACKCGCGFADIDLRLVRRLQMIRDALNMPLRIESGCRCSRYNERVGGKPNSAHTRGKAADVFVASSHHRFLLLREAFKHFSRIEVPTGNWIHVDVDEILPQEVCFTN